LLQHVYQWYSTIEEGEDIANIYIQVFKNKYEGVTKHYLNVIDKFSASESNLPLLTMVPVAIWGHKLDRNSLYAVVKLVVMMTHSHELVVEACYIYCFAIQQLIKGETSVNAFYLTK
jgi:ADP-ribosylglycohydrolase